MPEDATGICRVVLACGTVELRNGIDGLIMIIGDKYKQNPFEKGVLFLFGSKRSDRCKGFYGWGQDSCFSISEWFEDRWMSWLRTTEKAVELTEE